MEIITHGLINGVKVKGFVDIKVYHPEDIQRMEPLHSEEGDNTIQSYLTQKIGSEMRRTSGSSDYQLNQWPNVNSTSRCYPSFDGTDHDRTYTSNSSYLNGADGIFCETASGGETGYTFPGGGQIGDFTNALALGHGSDMAQSVSTNTFTMIGECTWLGKNEGGASLTAVTSSNISNFEMGKDFNCKSSTNSDFTFGHSSTNMMYAQYSASNFTLDVNDQLKVTWSIQIT